MTDQPLHTIHPVENTRLKLRDELVFSPRTLDADPHYVVEDPLNSKFFRLGIAEYAFVSLLDGGTSIAQAMSLLSTHAPEHALNEQRAFSLAKWLVDAGLARPADENGTVSAAVAEINSASPPLWARLNPLVFKLPLGSPQAYFTRISPWFGWLLAPLPSVLGIAFIAYGLYTVAEHWSQWEQSSRDMLSPSNWITLAIVWVVLKLLHETAHGLACYRYGGDIREWGLLLIVFAPCAYIDITSSWRFRSKWQRIHAAVAGMYIELLVASAAALVWSSSPDSMLGYFAFQTMITASVTTILFNANPLMKFDGYYVVSDWLAIPNLYSHGSTYWTYWCRRYLCGVPATLPPWPRGSRIIIACYGAASLVWRVLVCVGLAFAAAALLHGWEIILAVWLGIPSIRLARYLVFGKPGEQPKRWRLAVVGLLPALLVLVGLNTIPWCGVRQAAAVVEYSPGNTLRAAGSGFIREVHVASGEVVQPGQVLLVLSNPELEQQLTDLEIAIGQSKIRSRALQQKGQIAAHQAEDQKLASLLEQFSEKRKQADQLTVRAPCSGMVTGRHLANLIGTYVSAGDELVTVGDERHKRLLISVSQEDFGLFTRRVGEPVHVRVWGHGAITADLSKITPRASDECPEWLSAAQGGSLVTKPADESAANRAAEAVLIAPRFVGFVELDADQGGAVHCGQLGSVSFCPLSESIAAHLALCVRRDRFHRLVGLTARRIVIDP